MLRSHRWEDTALADQLQILSASSSITRLCLDVPEVCMPAEDASCLAQLTSLHQLTLHYLPQDIANLSTDPLIRSPLSSFSSLTNLQKLSARGLLAPLAASVRGPCLPESLTSLVLQGSRRSRASDHCFVESWLQHAVACTELQQLHLLDFRYNNRRPDPDCLFCGGVVLGQLQSLRELRFSFAAADDPKQACEVGLPASVAQLTNLEVLWVGTKASRYPWEQHYWWDSERVLPALLSSCSNLTSIGNVMADQDDGGLLSAPIAARVMGLHVTSDIGDLAAWVTLTAPTLRHLVVESVGFKKSMLADVRKLTQLTFLRLDTSWAFANEQGAGWAGLAALGDSLPQLQRLELGSYHSNAFDTSYRLAMPDLSAFMQIKQLQLLGCIEDPTKPLPQQPIGDDVLRCLSKLTQLEQLEVIGLFEAVTPKVLSVLVEGMPSLRVVEVGVCKVLEMPSRRVNGDHQEVRPRLGAHLYLGWFLPLLKELAVREPRVMLKLTEGWHRVDRAGL